jgi:hypothetical protein
LPDDMRRWPDTPEEAAYAQRQAAERLAHTPDTDAGWLACLASQFPPPLRPPLRDEVEHWYLTRTC